MDIWTPEVGEMLILKSESNNPIDVHAVAVLQEGQIVGHQSYNLALTIKLFLQRVVDKGFAAVTGPKVNTGAGYSLEIPVLYKFYPKHYRDKLKLILDSLTGYCLQ